MGCAILDCRLKIPTHAHAQVFEIIATGNFSQKIEVFFRCLINRGNAHKTRYGESMCVAAFLNKTVSAGNANSRLLFFITGIDLNEEFKLPPLLRHFCSNGLGNTRSVYRVDCI